MGSSSDDEPLLGDLLRGHNNVTNNNSEDSDLPLWIHEQATPLKRAAAVESDLDTDDSDAEIRASSRPQTVQGVGTSNAAAKPGQPPAAAGAASSSAAALAAAQNPLLAVGGTSDKVVILPERLIRNKVLVELEPAPHQATELSGDAGAVGRLVASSSTAEDRSFKIDLKGVLYQATVHPLAGTAFVINMGQTDAKIESVMNDFVRLREEQSYVGMTTLEGDYGMAELMADDEDNYQVGAGEEGKEAGDKVSKKAAVKRSKAGTSKAAAAGKALKAAKAGVKKKTGAKKAAGKGSKAAAAKPKGASKAAKGSAAKKPISTKAKTLKASAAKPKPAKQKKKLESDDDDDDADEGDSDWSMD